MEYEPETKTCQNYKNDFMVEPDDFLFYEKIKVPAPTFCPLCRAERRMTFRNERKLFKVRDALNNNEIFSIYPEECGKSIITNEDWRSDSWDAMDYGVDYDFSKSFLEQFFELDKKIPLLAMRTQHMVDSPYCANATALKNCYLTFGSSYSEDCMYGQNNDFSKDSLDCVNIYHSERCYYSFWLEHCYQCYFSIISKDSHNLYFCKNCIGCNDCFGCVDLRKSSYCIYNKQYTKEAYEEKIKEMNLNTFSGIEKYKKEARNFWLTYPTKCHQGLRNINSTGSYVTDCKNVNDSYFIKEGENIKYSQYLSVPKSKDCYDSTSWGDGMELHYETCLCGDHSFNIKFSDNCWPSSKNLEYCMNLANCSECFGCSGLKKKQYCILNKQYTKEEYEEMIPKIIKHINEMPYVDKKGNVYRYGEFFPIEFSSFGYNNSVAIQHFNLTKEEAVKNGYPWIEVEKGKYKINKKSYELNDFIEDENKKILEETIECNKCNGAYRILENELIFYKKENLPIPHLCYECRHLEIIKDKLKIQLYTRRCMCNGKKDINNIYINTGIHLHEDNICSEEFKTGYSPDSSEIIYCEKCYQQEVI